MPFTDTEIDNYMAELRREEQLSRATPVPPPKEIPQGVGTPSVRRIARGENGRAKRALLAPLLDSEQELKFQGWYKEIAEQMNLHPDPDHPEHYYDYRDAWLNEAQVADGHLPSEYKRKGHPTYHLKFGEGEEEELTAPQDTFPDWTYARWKEAIPTRPLTKEEKARSLLGELPGARADLSGADKGVRTAFQFVHQAVQSASLGGLGLAEWGLGIEMPKPETGVESVAGTIGSVAGYMLGPWSIAKGVIKGLSKKVIARRMLNNALKRGAKVDYSGALKAADLVLKNVPLPKWIGVAQDIATGVVAGGLYAGGEGSLDVAKEKDWDSLAKWGKNVLTGAGRGGLMLGRYSVVGRTMPKFWQRLLTNTLISQGYITGEELVSNKSGISDRIYRGIFDVIFSNPQLLARMGAKEKKAISSLPRPLGQPRRLPADASQRPIDPLAGVLEPMAYPSGEAIQLGTGASLVAPSPMSALRSEIDPATTFPPAPAAGARRLFTPEGAMMGAAETGADPYVSQQFTEGVEEAPVVDLESTVDAPKTPSVDPVYHTDAAMKAVEAAGGANPRIIGASGGDLLVAFGDPKAPVGLSVSMALPVTEATEENVRRELDATRRAREPEPVGAAPPIDEAALRATVESAGGTYLGIQEAADGTPFAVTFNDKEGLTRSTMMVPIGEVTEERIRGDIEEKRETVPAAEEKPPEPIEPPKVVAPVKAEAEAKPKVKPKISIPESEASLLEFYTKGASTREELETQRSNALAVWKYLTPEQRQRLDEAYGQGVLKLMKEEPTLKKAPKRALPVSKKQEQALAVSGVEAKSVPMFHGTSTSAAKDISKLGFDTGKVGSALGSGYWEKGMFGSGIYLTDRPDIASAYGGQAAPGDSDVVKVQITGKILDVERSDDLVGSVSPREETGDMRGDVEWADRINEKARALGYVGAKYGPTDTVIWEPNAIKVVELRSDAVARERALIAKKPAERALPVKKETTAHDVSRSNILRQVNSMIEETEGIKALKRPATDVAAEIAGLRDQLSGISEPWVRSAESSLEGIENNLRRRVSKKRTLVSTEGRALDGLEGEEHPIYGAAKAERSRIEQETGRARMRTGAKVTEEEAEVEIVPDEALPEDAAAQADAAKTFFQEYKGTAKTQEVSAGDLPYGKTFLYEDSKGNLEVVQRVPRPVDSKAAKDAVFVQDGSKRTLKTESLVKVVGEYDDPVLTGWSGGATVSGQPKRVSEYIRERESSLLDLRDKTAGRTTYHNTSLYKNPELYNEPQDWVVGQGKVSARGAQRRELYTATSPIEYGDFGSYGVAEIAEKFGKDREALETKKFAIRDPSNLGKKATHFEEFGPTEDEIVFPVGTRLRKVGTTSDTFSGEKIPVYLAYGKRKPGKYWAQMDRGRLARVTGKGKDWRTQMEKATTPEEVSQVWRDRVAEIEASGGSRPQLRDAEAQYRNNMQRVTFPSDVEGVIKRAESIDRVMDLYNFRKLASSKTGKFSEKELRRIAEAANLQEEKIVAQEVQLEPSLIDRYSLIEDARKSTELRNSRGQILDATGLIPITKQKLQRAYEAKLSELQQAENIAAAKAKISKIDLTVYDAKKFGYEPMLGGTAGSRNSIISAIHARAATKWPSLEKEAREEELRKFMKGVVGKGYMTSHPELSAEAMTLDELKKVASAMGAGSLKLVEGKKTDVYKPSKDAVETQKRLLQLQINLTEKGHLNDEYFQRILDRELGEGNREMDIAQARKVMRAMHEEAEIIKRIEPVRRAIEANPEYKEAFDKIEEPITKQRIATWIRQGVNPADLSPEQQRVAMEILREAKIRKLPVVGKVTTGLAHGVRDPLPFESMRYYAQQAQLKTDSPIYTVHMALMREYAKVARRSEKAWDAVMSSVPDSRAIRSDPAAVQRVNDYIASQSNLENKPEVPPDLTENERTLAENIQRALKFYEPKVRIVRLLNFIYEGQPIPGYSESPEVKAQVDKALEVYDTEGYEAAAKLVEGQDWGVYKQGYEPLESVVLPQIDTGKKLPVTAVGKTRVMMRTELEYKAQERDIFQRLDSYMRQMNMLSDLRPIIIAYTRLWNDAIRLGAFKKPQDVVDNVTLFLDHLKHHTVVRSWMGKAIRRVYGQAMTTRVLANIPTSFRNVLQNFAMEPDKSILVDPRNKTLTDDEVEFVKTDVLSTKGLMQEHLMTGEKALLPQLEGINRAVRRVAIYPYSDIGNRYWSFWGKINQVKRAQKGAKSFAEVMKGAKFADLTRLEQQYLIGIQATEGPEMMAKFASKMHVDDIHFRYPRAERSPAEMGEVGALSLNLALFPRASGERVTKATGRLFGRGYDFETRYRAAKIVSMAVFGGLIVGELFRRITGRAHNPYHPFTILSYHPGGLAFASYQDAGEVGVLILQAIGGYGQDEATVKRARARLPERITHMPDLFVGFYDISLRMMEGVTGTKDLDRAGVRWVMDKLGVEVKRRGPERIRRNFVQQLQYILAGRQVDEKIKERARKIKHLKTGPRKIPQKMPVTRTKSGGY